MIENLFDIKNYNIKKMILNFLFSFVLTIVFFSLPLTSGDEFSPFFSNIWYKLGKGALLSTVINVNGTYMITLWSRLKRKYAIKTEQTGYFEYVIIIQYLPIPFFCSLLAFGLMFLVQKETLHWLMIVFEIIIYIISLLHYGYTEKQLSEPDLVKDAQNYEIQQESKEDEINLKVNRSKNLKNIAEKRKKMQRDNKNQPEGEL